MIEDAIQWVSDIHAFFLLIEWLLFIGIIIVGFVAWLLLQLLNKN